MNAIPTDRWISPAALRRHALPALLVLGGLAAPAALAEAPSLRDTLARGLVAEEVNRDLEAARRDYEAVLASFADQRAVAASALFRLAEIHRTQGRKDEATAQYQRLLREFPDAEREKDLARRQLEAWEIEIEPAAPEGAAMDLEEMTLQRLRNLRQSSPDLLRKSNQELDLAISNGMPRVLEFLIGEGLDAGHALRFACEAGNLAAVKIILAGETKPDAASVREAVVASVGNEFHEIFDQLLAAKLDLNSQDGQRFRTNGAYGTVLHQLAHPSHLDKIRRLIEAGADVNAVCVRTGFTPLHVAIHRSENILGDFPSLVKLLLDKGADLKPLTTHRWPYFENHDPFSEDPNAKNPEASLSALDLAMLAKRPDLLTLLIERGADPKQEGLLARACELSEGLEIVRLLLKRGADPNLPLGHPPLRRAFENIADAATPNEQSKRHRHQVALIRLLLEHGADPNAKVSSFTRQPFRSSVTSGSDYGRSLFVENPQDRQAIASGWFYEVIRLYEKHRILNLELVKILLDAGAVPGEDFPEIFTFVATGGASVRSGGGMVRQESRPGGGITLVDGDAEAPEIARALLKHRPEKIHFENLKGVSGWEAGVRRVFLDEVVFPHLHQSIGGVTLCHFISSCEVQTLVEAGKPVADTASLLFGHLEKFNALKLTRVRRMQDGTWQRDAIDWRGAEPLPELQAGDIVEMEPEQGASWSSSPYEPVPNQDLFRWSLWKRMPAISVTFEVDGSQRDFLLRPDLLAFDPAKNEAPRLHAIALARLLGQGLNPEGLPDAVKSGVLTLRREGWPDLKFNLSDSNVKAFPLEAGDHLILERDSLSRTSDITLVVPGMAFVRQFVPFPPPTLVQAIADAWSPWQDQHATIPTLEDNQESLAWRAARQFGPYGEVQVSVFPRDPDFSRIRIRRVSGERREEVIEVDLQAAIQRAGEESADAEEIRRADVELKAGDIIEIPLRERVPGADAWRGFSQDLIRFFEIMLAARYVWIDPEEGVLQKEYRYHPPRWVDGPHGLIALPPEEGSPTARHSTISRGHVYGVKEALRDGKPLPYTSTGDWFVRDGDQLTSSQNIIPRQPVNLRRPRVVIPPRGN